MALSEFKAWFEGYTEGLEGAPTKAQFDRIKEKVKEISGQPITERIFVDRYRDRYFPMWQQSYVTYSAGSPNLGVGAAVLSNFGAVPGAAPESARYSVGDNQTVEFNIHAAMYALGKAEAAAA